jgi:uncharacterized membrane protein
VARGRAPKPNQEIEWDFFSFPCAFTFAAGLFTMVILVTLIPFNLLFIVALFAVSFGTAHVIAHSLRKRGVVRRRDKAEEEERERRALSARGINIANAGAAEAIATQRRRRRRR